jgi:TonB-linked SusC/RagA family outer membrane protein
LISTGGLYDNAQHIRASSGGSNIQSKIIDPKLFTGPGQNPAEYTSYMPVSSLSRPYYDFSVVPWVLRAESLEGALLSRSKLYQFQLDYSRKFGKHNVGLLGLFKRQDYAWGSEFKHYREDWVFRGTYDYDSKYLFETNGAYNGSEQFGPNYRFAFFPSVALGWVVSNEKFFKIDWMNRLKFRLSGGLVGDDNISGTRWLYADQMVYAAYAGSVPMDAANVNTGRSPYKIYDYSVIGNPDIHWEKARKYNFGLESGLFDNLVSITYDYFTEHRTDMLLTGDQRAIAPYFGFTPPSANIGEVNSHGYELELKFDKRMGNGFHPWATLAISHTKNKILFKDDPALLASYLKAEGYAVGQQRTTVRAGFMNNWNDIYASVPLDAADNQKIPGFWNILDFNGDGAITSLDVVPYNYSQVPQNTYSTTFGAEYNGFSVMMMFYGVNNVTRSYSYNNFNAYTDVVFTNLLDAWSKDNQNASAALPRWRSQGGSIGDYNLKDGSYLRLKTVEIAYTFKDKWVKKANLSALRVYLNGNNLFLWTNLPDDREAAFVGGGSGGAYPTVKRFNLGIDVTF